MVNDIRKILIVGLGNPGKKYELTRHNFGQMILYGFAKKHHLVFAEEKNIKGNLAQGRWGQEKLLLLFPTTYMNLSGKSVHKAISFYKVALQNVLVISDDIALPFGAFRFRLKGSAGGHNGLKSIQDSLRTQEYQRLRIGVGEPTIGLLENYVLDSFSKNEMEEIPKIIDEGINYLEKWLLEKIKECNEQRK